MSKGKKQQSKRYRKPDYQRRDRRVCVGLSDAEYKMFVKTMYESGSTSQAETIRKAIEFYYKSMRGRSAGRR